MKVLGWLALSISILAVQPCGAAVNSITAVRHWSLSDVTRIIVEVSGDFEYRSDRLHDPERIYFDLLNARPHIQGQKSYTEHLDDPLVSRIRIALHTPEITRVVVDLNGEIDVTASRLSNPNRLIIELRKRTAVPQATPSAPPVETVSSVPSAPPVVKTPPPAAPLVKPASTPPPVTLAKAEMPKPEAPKVDVPKPEVTKAEPVKTEVSRPAISKPEPPKTASGPSSAEIGKSARRTSDGQTSLVRALGLKLGRVVIDPGHGGHDQGTRGVHGLLEKDLVLDVAQRVGKLIEDKMGAEVIYTRTDDTFIPLEGRTAMANDKKADLFLSIHANSSPVPRIAGVETYYLNFTNSRDALDVASRENASSQKSIFELQDIIQKITQHDKAEESREFASRMQSSIYSFSAHYFPAEKNRGVKKAPFVVLIGAHMPSILAEIGFLSNNREEALLKRPDYRQRLAEALFRGVQRYAETLSHFQVAQAKDE
jgi:N-acetylmuramoyl-L-alanine amidase